MAEYLQNREKETFTCHKRRLRCYVFCYGDAGGQGKTLGKTFISRPSAFLRECWARLRGSPDEPKLTEHVTTPPEAFIVSPSPVFGRKPPSVRLCLTPWYASLRRVIPLFENRGRLNDFARCPLSPFTASNKGT